MTRVLRSRPTTWIAPLRVARNWRTVTALLELARARSVEGLSERPEGR